MRGLRSLYKNLLSPPPSRSVEIDGASHHDSQSVLSPVSAAAVAANHMLEAFDNEAKRLFEDGVENQPPEGGMRMPTKRLPRQSSASLLVSQHSAEMLVGSPEDLDHTTMQDSMSMTTPYGSPTATLPPTAPLATLSMDQPLDLEFEDASPSALNSSRFVEGGRDSLSCSAPDAAGRDALSVPPKVLEYLPRDDGENVRVMVRVRPLNAREQEASANHCISFTGNQGMSLHPNPDQHAFLFDRVFAPEATQDTVFQEAARPVVDNCIAGYHSSVFAYGQTGSGKTHTMMGRLGETGSACQLASADPERGVIPRMLEHLFVAIKEAEADSVAEGGDRVKFACKCSFLEIYNESIADLLDSSAINLQVREDVKRGVYVDNLTEAGVVCKDDALDLLQQGAANRRVGETRMNRESSRSHSVFTVVLESTRTTPAGVHHHRFSRLHLVDLAGSERQKTSRAMGERLKEASSINKSLSTLGLVIMSLVDVANGRRRHVPYRDSRLTFLLQDSLGGNAKTIVIATVSPSSDARGESLSTLRFAQRAKCIRNKAVVNENTDGDIVQLKQQIKILKEELAMQRISLQKPVMTQAAAPPPLEAGVEVVEGALRREQAALQQLKAVQEQVDLHKEMASAKDREMQGMRMVIKFKTAHVQRLEHALAARSSEEMADAAFLAQKSHSTSLQHELQLANERLEHHPEVIRFAAENLRLAEEVRSLVEFVGGDKEALQKEIHHLRSQVLDRSQTSINTPNTRERAAAKAAAEQSLLLEENWANLEHAKQAVRCEEECKRAELEASLEAARTEAARNKQALQASLDAHADLQEQLISLQEALDLLPQNMSPDETLRSQNKELLAELDAARSRCASLEAESAERDAELQALAQEAATLRTAAERAPGLEEELAASAQRVRVLELAVQEAEGSANQNAALVSTTEEATQKVIQQLEEGLASTKQECLDAAGALAKRDEEAAALSQRLVLANAELDQALANAKVASEGSAQLELELELNRKDLQEMSKLAASRLSELQAIQENAQTAAMLASASALELSEARSDLETARAACQEKQDLVQALLGSQAEREERAVGLAAEASAAIKLAARRKEELDAVGSKIESLELARAEAEREAGSARKEAQMAKKMASDAQAEVDAAKALVGEWEKEVRSAGVDADRASSHLQEMEKALREARAQAEDAVQQANLAQQELADARLGAAEEADTLRAQVAEAEAGARGVQNALQHSESRTEVLREEVQAWKTKCHDAKERASTLATETASLAAALASLQSELDQTRARTGTHEPDGDDRTHAAATAHSQTEKALQEALEQIASLQRTRQRDEEELLEARRALDEENNDVEGAVVRALNEVNSIQSSPQFERDQTLKELEGAIETTESQLQDALAQVSALELARGRETGELAATKRALGELEIELQAAQTALADVSVDKAQLQNMQEQLADAHAQLQEAKMESRQVDKQLSIKSEQLLNLRAEVITQMDMAWSGDSQRDMRDLWKPQLDQAESKLMAAERELQAERALSASTQQALEELRCEMELVDRKKSQAIQRNLELEEQWNVCNQEVSDWEERCLTAQARAETLESQLGEMAGQSNLSQRIQLHQQIKNENIDLREELEKQQEVNRRQASHLERSRAELNKLKVAMRGRAGS